MASRIIDSATFSRRSTLGLLLGGVAAAAIAPRRGWAASGTVVVSNWGGDWNDRTVRYVEKPLLEDKGFSIVRDLGTEPERKAKLISEKRIRRASADVIHINSSDAFELQKQGVVAELDTARIPNYADTAPELQSPYFVPWLYSGVVIIYDTTKVSEPPKSYAELWDPKWAGKVGLTNQLYFNYMMMAGLVEKGDMTSVEDGKARLERLVADSKPRLYAAHQQLQAGLANGEVEIAVNYKARGLQWAHDGLPLAIQYPEEGAIAVTFGACLTQFAANPDAGYAYLDAMLDPQAMAGLAEASFYAPANTKAALSDDLRQLVDFSAEERAKMRFLDFDYVAQNTAAWLEWWNKSFAV
ncbi:ABC transporter substrate-binding protein [Paracoccus yeei]|uniref:ABC transporter substrate-binding protein n=1 Tax=Paracoccus yeei TaxID=147645 RepID=UPI00049040B5|nr:extracellular solute-binding protein [Paracoccus yeei]OWJ95868.1 ABC transporter substrate-binding protein [Paracoccus yeei]